MTKSVKFALLAVSALGTGVFAGGLPQGGVVQEGSASITYAGGGGGYISLDINQRSDKAVIDWHSFSVGKGNTVNFNQPSSDSATLNRVTGDFTSEIAGRINSNGSVFLVNPNGIRITADGVIDTGGFVASTLDIDNNDFLNGEYTFTKNGNSGVVSNRGSISVDDGGFVALLGGAVKNDGMVRALVGKVGFAGGEKIVMSFGNSDFLRVEVPTDKWDTLTDSQGNKVAATLDLGGTIDSRGGFIDITVADASDILRQTISIDGIVSANTVSSTDGVISISGGTVGITGNGRITADADYGTAGTIAIEADTIDSSGTVSAVAQNGTGGTVKISLQHGANLNASTRFDVSGGNKGGSLSFIGGLGKQGTKVLGSADFKADSTDGSGGYVDISNKGGLVGLLSGTVSASGKTQGGRIRLGGAFQGGGYDPKTSPLDKRTQDLFVTRWADNGSLVSAGKTSLGTGVRVDVSSASGTGGTAIVWADHTTNNYAAIDATGATGGGAVEISGKKQVDSFGLKRIKAGNGVILLDPQNLVIGNWGSAVAQAKKIAHGVSGVSLNDGDAFGSSVSLSSDGTKLAVGAGGDDDGGKTSSGAVYLYTVGGSSWGEIVTQVAKLSNSHASVSLDKSDWFGSGGVSLSSDGTKLAVGVYLDDDGGNGKGAVYLYTVGGSSWGKTVTQAAKLSDSHTSVSLDESDWFGSGVSLSGDGTKLAVGAEGDDDGGNGKGAVYLYTVGGFSWGETVTQVVKLSDSHTSVSLDKSDWFGSSVSLNGDGTKLAVGADGDDSYKGAVYLYIVGGSSWGSAVTQAVKLSNSHASVSLGNNDYFGSSVSLSGDGTKLAVGADGDDDGGFNRGAVYLYIVGGSGATWGSTVTQAAKLSHKHASVSLDDSDYFGVGVSLSGDGTKLAVGAKWDDDRGSNQHANRGAVYLYTIGTDADDYKQQLQDGDVTLVASNDITINRAINADSGGGTLTLIAGRSIKINADVKVNGGLVLKANDASDSDFILSERDTGKAHITVATGKTISGGNGNLLIKMLKGSSSAAAEKKQTGKITVWKAEGKRVSIVHTGISDSEIVILSGGRITSKSTSLAPGAVGIELVADTFTNNSDSNALSVTSGRYLVWTKTHADNTMGGIIPPFSQYNLAYDTTKPNFHSTGVKDTRSGFVYSNAKNSGGNNGGGNNGGNNGDNKGNNGNGGDLDLGNSGSGGGGGSSSGGGAAVVALVGTGVAVSIMGGGVTAAGAAGAAGAGAAGAAGGAAGGASGASGVIGVPLGRIDTIFNTNIYAQLNGIDMQALYQPSIQKPFASVFNTPQQVTYKAKYKSQIHRTYDMALLTHNIKAQKAVPLYELDADLYETLKRIFVQQSTVTDKTARTDTQAVLSET